MKLIKKYNANFNLRQNINFCPLFLIPILIKFCLKAIMLSLDRPNNVKGKFSIADIKNEYIVIGICVSKSNNCIIHRKSNKK